ncbi:uncharacterized protein [Henckelia pumila]|uniref:uncharacterized protein n=1 Tax=Henckelia pumila TaxID=405737 RepID=UPI003C6E87CB
MPCPLTLEEAMEHEMKHGRLFNDPNNVDLKKIRRIVSNRLSAQRSRIKIVNYTSDSEKMIKDLEDRISILISQVESSKEKKILLELENDSLQRELEKRSTKSKSLELAIEEERSQIKLIKEPEKTAQKNKGKEIQDLHFQPPKVTKHEL